MRHRCVELKEEFKVKYRKLLISIVLLTTLSNQSIYAGNRPFATTLTAAEGYYMFDSKWHLQDKGMPNIALAFDFTRKWAMEATAGTFMTRSEDYHHNRNVRGNLYTLDALYRITSYLQYEPYIAFGVGYLNVDSAPNAINGAGINAALGSQYFFSKSIALRLEFKDIYSTNHARNDFLINLGMSFVFGGCTDLSAPTNAEASYNYKRFFGNCVGPS